MDFYYLFMTVVVIEAYYATLYQMLSAIIFWRVTPCVDDIIVDHLWGFWSNRLVIDQTFCLQQILEEECEHSTIVHQPIFVDFKETCDSFSTKELCNILIIFPTRLNETHMKVRIGKILSHSFSIQDGLKQRMCHEEGQRKPGGAEIKLNTSVSLCWTC
jgi:hypothetical protein